MTRQRAKSAQSRVCGGLFTPDPTLPADQAGRQVCRCGLIGEAGDASGINARPPP